jgi:outer membrane protein assembly factor BamB
MRMPKCSGWLVLASLVVGGESRSADWPQWRGPNRDGHSAETGLLKSIPAGGPKLLWTFDQAGLGYSGVAVAGGKLYSLGGDEQSEYAFAVDVATGRQLWRTPFGGKYEHERGDGPRSTPTVDGDAIYVLGANSDLARLDVTTGKVRWATNLKKGHGGQLMSGWGYSESPLVDGEKLIATPGGKSATLVALAKQTGKPLWRSQVPQGDGAAYSSVIAADVAGQRQYIQFLGGGVVGVSAKDGRFLWRYDAPHNGTANCSTPLYQDGRVFAASGYGTGGGQVKLLKQGNGFKAEQVYFTKSMKNHHGGMVLVDGCIYGSNEGRLACLDFETGKVLWEDRRPGKGSIAYADGHLYYRNEDGPVVLVEASPKGYVERGRFTPVDASGKPAWPHPIIANGRLYILDQDVLLCYDVKQR